MFLAVTLGAPSLLARDWLSHAVNYTAAATASSSDAAASDVQRPAACRPEAWASDPAYALDARHWLLSDADRDAASAQER